MSRNNHLEIDQKMVGDVYTSNESMDVLTTLCDVYGSRFGGTEGERLSAEFMRDKMIEYGLQNVHLEEFPYVAWHRGTTTLEIISPIQKTIPCISLPHSPPCNLEATLIDLGDGAPDDYDALSAEIDGKIVMANSKTYPKGGKRWIHRSEKYGRSLLAGASGFIFVNHYPAYGPATGGISIDQGGEAAIPGISVSYEDGSFLSRIVKRYGEVTVRITSDDHCFDAVSWNVLGEIPGAGSEVVMLGSHYDGHDISQGAQDPASGAAAVLEAARVMAKHAGDMDCTVRFALWGVEEIGLLGSRYHAEAHDKDLDNMRFYFNMDGAGSVKNKGVIVNEWDPIVELVKNWQQEMALDFGVDQSVSAFSDHYPFLLKGVPTGGLQSVPKGTGGRGYGHTRYDTLDKVTVRELQDAAVMAARLALRFANCPDWPVERRSVAAVEALFEDPDYQATRAISDAVEAWYAERDSA